MNFNNMKVPKVPGGGGISALLKVSIIGGLAVYGATNTLYNVDGGHRAIVFNRLVGVKDKSLSSTPGGNNYWSRGRITLWITGVPFPGN
ncbi:prohibitin mitochondrial-like [Trifolium pratense]|uniref:Prohibitin n=1 Tax=Trifolium pratense TaxID=57577 RepID=A0A2K3LRR7_TRIPR|nr:prohibitin mitochondrial-like [Trifolium pratense]